MGGRWIDGSRGYRGTTRLHGRGIYGSSLLRVPQDAWFSSSHFRTSLLKIIPIGRSCSSSVRGRYNRMMYPDTLQMSSHSASKSVHQQCGGFDGSEIPQWRVVSKIAALIIVGTAYSAYTGVCNLGDIQPRTAKKGAQTRTRH